MLMTPCCILNSQNIYKVTSDQLRITNLIFAEHERYTKLIPFLQDQIDNLKLGWDKSDSINKIDLFNKQLIIDNQSSTINKLSKTLDTKNKLLIGTTASSIVLLLICLIQK